MDFEFSANNNNGTTNKSPDLDNFLSFEKLDRCSPEPWSMPGLNEFASLIKTPAKNTSNPSSQTNCNQNNSKWMADLNKNDIEMLNDLATLNPNQLVDKVKDLFDYGYQLGLEESNEMTRGKLLNILDSKINS